VLLLLCVASAARAVGPRALQVPLCPRRPAPRPLLSPEAALLLHVCSGGPCRAAAWQGVPRSPSRGVQQRHSGLPQGSGCGPSRVVALAHAARPVGLVCAQPLLRSDGLHPRQQGLPAASRGSLCWMGDAHSASKAQGCARASTGGPPSLAPRLRASLGPWLLWLEASMLPRRRAPDEASPDGARSPLMDFLRLAWLPCEVSGRACPAGRGPESPLRDLRLGLLRGSASGPLPGPCPAPAARIHAAAPALVCLAAGAQAVANAGPRCPLLFCAVVCLRAEPRSRCRSHRRQLCMLGGPLRVPVGQLGRAHCGRALAGTRASVEVQALAGGPPLLPPLLPSLPPFSLS